MSKVFISAMSSGGALPKGKYELDGEKILIKGSSPYCFEAISECLVSNLLDILEIEHIK